MIWFAVQNDPEMPVDWQPVYQASIYANDLTVICLELLGATILMRACMSLIDRKPLPNLLDLEPLGNKDVWDGDLGNF